MSHQLFDSLQSFRLGDGSEGYFYSLPQLEKAGVGPISRLPVSIRILLEAVLRHYDGQRITEEDVRALASWRPTDVRTREVPFIVARILLQDFTGVPLLVDLAAMRSAVTRLGRNPKIVEPLAPVDLVIDHSVQVDYWSRPDAVQRNMEMEFKRNAPRYAFLKWGMHAFRNFSVVPSGIGIVHQVNLEYLARGVLERAGLYYPDTLVGTDSHTTMINGLGIVGWGVGGIEAEAGMLGQPVSLLTPDVIGVHLSGALRPGVTATDLVLHITQLLRRTNVVGKFVEFHGEGAASLSAPDRATIGNMAPEYGATMGYFPVDEETCAYLVATGRSETHVATFRNYFQAQGLFGTPRRGQCQYTSVLDLDLGEVEPCVAGPKRPQDRLPLSAVKSTFLTLLQKPLTENGYGLSAEEAGARVSLMKEHPEPEGKQVVAGGGEQAEESVPVGAQEVSTKNTSMWTEQEMMNNRPTPDLVRKASSPALRRSSQELGHGDIVIAALTSCTNTSNPAVMLAAGLVAKKAVERGLRVRPTVKCSLAPGSRAVTVYLEKTGLLPYLTRLGFQLVGYGCTTCIGNSGPLDPHLETVITEHDLVTASVLSGNRNFEARVHQNVKANFLMSPPLVVAFALAGRVDMDLSQDPIARDDHGQPVYLQDLWPTAEELTEALQQAHDPETYRRLYADVTAENSLWNAIPSSAGDVYAWDPESTYIQEPPYFANFQDEPGEVTNIIGARLLALFGDSITTDHISPAGAIKPASPAGLYLQENQVAIADFNTYGARRGNDRVMVRGTFANIRLKNEMTPRTEGGITIHHPSGQCVSIYDAAQRYYAEGVPLLIIAGREYGAGSSRDWAAKGTRLLGVRAVVAESFERIHRSNLIGMGVLPCQFPEGVNRLSLKLDGSERYDIFGLMPGIEPRHSATLIVHRANGETETVPVIARIDTPLEAEHYRHGGILPYVLRHLLADGRRE